MNGSNSQCHGSNQEKMDSQTDGNEKSFKICSVLGALDVTRFISRDAQSFFAGAIEDIELIREVISENASNGGVGHRMTLAELNTTLDRHGRGYDDDDSIQTTLEAGLGYVDDRPDRRIDLWVSLFNLGAKATRQSYYNSTDKVDASAELAIIQAAALIFPWVVDRKAKPSFWSLDHQNGRSTGRMKAPFHFDSFYSAAWIGSWGETWAYYPPMNQLAGGEPYTLSDNAGANATTHDALFIKQNLPWNNPTREAHFTKPYPDYAEAGASIISSLAPLYYTGTVLNETFDDTYIASLGLDIHVDSISRLLDVATKLSNGSFAILVDFDLDIIVISQEVVEKLYPERTGFEDERVTYDFSGLNIAEDRRNVTYLVSDTIFQGLSKLENAHWNGLRESLDSLCPGERDFSKLNITLTGEKDAIEFYVMYEKWRYVADWALLIFAPVEEVNNAIQVRISKTTDRSKLSSDIHKIELNARKGETAYGHATIKNTGSLDIIISPRETPHWLKLQQPVDKTQIFRAGEMMDLSFQVITDELSVGTTSSTLSFHIQDDSYPDCFYDKEKGLTVTVHVSLGYSSYLAVAFFIFAGFIAFYTYFEWRKKEADSLWEVKNSELVYDDPPEVLGRGTFGLVLRAEYRGTYVAVKRVIPPKNTKLTGSSSSISAIFDYSDLFDEEELKELKPVRRRSYGTAKVDPGLSRGMIAGSLSSDIVHIADLIEIDNATAPLNSSIKSVDGMIGSYSIENKPSRTKSKAYLKEDFVQEMRVLSKLRHPCITTFMGAVTALGEEPLLVMECMNRGR